MQPASVADGPASRRVLPGRGAVTNPEGRFAATRSVPVDDGWTRLEDEDASVVTEVRPERARTLITQNASPDIPFDRSINPYRGCEHGCIYCYARPAHAYVDLSPGLDFETRILFKADAERLLTQELAKPGYRCRPIAFGTNTDPYQPLERRLRVTRRLLELLSAHDHPVTITTRGAAILDDLELLADMARRDLVSVGVSLTTLDDDLKRILEPRTPSGTARLRTIRALREAGVPVGVMTAPIIPAINDAELESLLEAAAEAGAERANWILLRLPNEVAALFRAWLAEHYPDRAAHVLSLVRQSRGGRLNDPRFGSRMRGDGAFASLIAQRFQIAVRRLGLSDRSPRLCTSGFRPPVVDVTSAPDASSSQLGLF
ncbi:MAG: PA0069 family radical SAM protein [Pseudomonadales bacterium]|nr:PA0069 family radical SAM protein [Pseudomonadales bacterium]